MSETDASTGGGGADLVRGIKRLSRRVRTLIVAAVLFLVLFVLVFTLPIPYVVLSPGPTYNTLGTDGHGTSIIAIRGVQVRKTSGNLNMTTVAVTTHSITPYEAFKGWLAGDEVVVPRSSVYPPGTSEKETDRQNTQDFIVSQDSAKVAALCELDYPKGFGVVTVDPKGPSHGKLKPGDRLVTVDGRDVSSADKLRTLTQSLDAGSTVTARVNREVGGKPRPTSVRVTLGAAPKGQQGARFGVEVSTTCLAPATIDLGLANQIGGPSAGLMFALGIIDKIGPTDLTHGRFIAGTGTIDATGKVGPIGGIQLKMIAAKRKGATVFLAPAANCDDVRGNVPAGLKVVKVATLHQAVTDLKRIEQTQSVPSC